MGRHVIETILGAVVLIVAGIFVFISYKSGNVAQNTSGYRLRAEFHEIGNVSIGSDVRVGGIKIGSVVNQYLDNTTFKAVLELNIKNDIKLPDDSSAAIVSDGLLGGKYLSIEPGGSEVEFKEGDVIQYTQDAVNIEGLIGKFAFGGVSDSDKKSDEPTDTNVPQEDNSQKNDLVPSLDLDL